MKFVFSMLSKLFGFNFSFTPKDVIVDQMNEPRPLPMGKADFDEWSNRLIAGALVPGGEENPDVFYDSQKFALANMILHLGPTESHKPDAFFIHNLRKVACNQVAHSVAQELKLKFNAEKARTAANENVSGQVQSSSEAVVQNP